MVGGLSHYVKVVVEEGSLWGIPLHGLKPPITHNQIVDDTVGHYNCLIEFKQPSET
jgi:hypothetical protein